ncbi:hypothetical protein FSARC_13978 [Fusarium sarcochroum]|uniref:DUF6594 domain-containing protein n=1 Tax=Fusarium sarcochroum TaxID=1208366 RepID=A0A8H4WR82_9HYPO|nr:hypothetical protein FSARC_13978 [Fusarium sarcochroum]
MNSPTTTQNTGNGLPAAGSPNAEQISPSDEGYPKLAKLMGESPETGIFRRFRQLNTLHLLRLQAELHAMEDELRDVIQEDLQSDDPATKDSSRNFFLLKRCAEQGKESEQYELLVEIGNKLNQYNAALSALNTVAEMPKPEKRPLELLRLWLSDQGQDGPFPSGTESTIWESGDSDEYISLDRTAANDRISSLVRGALLDIYHFGSEGCRKLISKFQTHDLSVPASGPSVRKYDDDKLRAVSDGITAALASLLPTGMILVLYFVKRMLVRIGLVIIFTTIFSIVMSFYPGAKKGEVFAAVAAFTAVEVVFIGSTSS